MKKPEWPGIATSVGVILIIAIVVWTAVWGPIEHTDWTIHFSDWITLFGILFGSACTIFAGWLAYSAVQIQIKDARSEVRKTNFNTLDEKVWKLSDEIYRLRLAAGFLSTFSNLFPPTGPGTSTGGFTACLQGARAKALDFISASATNAPFGYGRNISTVMTRVQRLGDRIEERFESITASGVSDFYDPIVRDAIIGLRDIATQIARDIPIHEQSLVRLSDERDRFKERK